MSDVLRTLDSLFRLSAAPVIGVRGNSPVYYNPAAEKFFGEPLKTLTAPELFPRWPYAADSIISAAVQEIHCTITVSSVEDLLVLSVSSAVSTDFASAIPMSALAMMASTITTLRMAVDRLVDLCPPEDQNSLYISILYQNYYKLLRIAEHLSLMTGLTAGTLPFNPQPLELGTFMSDLISSVRYLTAGMGIALEYAPPQQLITVSADANLIEQLILGLISNSIKSTPAGGKITLRVYENLGSAVISVDDTGSGIAPETMASVFQPGNIQLPFEVPELDSGLGLALASAIASQHGGTIVLDSRVGKGTSVRVMLKSVGKASGTLRSRELMYGNPIPVRALTELSTVLPRSQYSKEKIFGK